MKIIRWRADRKPTREEVEKMFVDEGLEFVAEDLPKVQKSKNTDIPFEIRLIIAGALRYNVAGNEFILREGDRLELPSNTRHRTKVEPGSDCVSIFAHRIF